MGFSLEVVRSYNTDYDGDECVVYNMTVTYTVVTYSHGAA